MKEREGAQDMNYDKIIVEMLSRIQILEEEVEALKKLKSDPLGEKDITILKKVTTDDICDYITCLKKEAVENSITLVANNIHNELKLKSRMPIVCNAMKRCMCSGDEVLFQTASGYSSTLKIKYYIGE